MLRPVVPAVLRLGRSPRVRRLLRSLRRLRKRTRLAVPRLLLHLVVLVVLALALVFRLSDTASILEAETRRPSNLLVADTP
jgi:hypothetical protein